MKTVWIGLLFDPDCNYPYIVDSRAFATREEAENWCDREFYQDKVRYHEECWDIDKPYPYRREQIVCAELVYFND